MGNNLKGVACCKCENRNQEVVEIMSITSREAYNVIRKIQSHVRGYLFRKKAKFFISCFKKRAGKSKPFDVSNCPGKEIDLSFEPNLSENVKLLKEKIQVFEVNEKESHILRFSNLKKMAIEYPDGSVYKGFFNEAWEREGYGQLFLPDGSLYEGFFIGNLMHGRGRILNSGGYSYDGEMANGKADGFGKYVTLEGVHYKGGWLDEKQHGHGEESYPDGSHFEGEYFMGKKNGRGKFKSPDGHFYDGDFLNNEIHGWGVYRWNDGRIYQGQWLNNKMNGTGIFIWPDKKKYIGTYMNDNKNGYGIFYWPDGRKFEGCWSGGKQSGPGALYDQKGIPQYGYWQNGKLKNTVTNDNLKEYNELIKELKTKLAESNIDYIDKLRTSYRTTKSLSEGA
jgi:hypothetical protein